MTIVKSNMAYDVKRSSSGKIKLKVWNKSQVVTMGTFVALLFLTVYGFLTFDYKEISLIEAGAATLHNLKVMFLATRTQSFHFVGGCLSSRPNNGVCIIIDDIRSCPFFIYRIICCKEFIDEGCVKRHYYCSRVCSSSPNCIMGINLRDCCGTWK